MKFNVRVETLSKMIELCKKHKEGKLKRDELLEILTHEDYELEFKRYGQKGLPMANITKDEFVEFFMNINKIKYEEIENERLKMRYPQLMELFNNTDYYHKIMKKVTNFNKEVYEEGIQYAINGLPKDQEFGDIDVVFTISIGNSCGWAYDNCIHFDILTLSKGVDLDNLEAFKAFVGHEIHHIFIAKYLNELESENLSFEEQFYNFFAYEGLAVKYCNNGEGPLTKKIYDIEPSIGMNKFAWSYYEKEFENMYKEFKKHVNMMKNSVVDTPEKFTEIIMEYWMTPFVKDEKGESIQLAHYRNYYLGMNIWGVIHDVYGKDKVFETFKNPKQFAKILNNALINIGREDLLI